MMNDQAKSGNDIRLGIFAEPCHFMNTASLVQTIEVPGLECSEDMQAEVMHGT